MKADFLTQSADSNANLLRKYAATDTPQNNVLPADWAGERYRTPNFLTDRFDVDATGSGISKYFGNYCE